eukprot:221823_1
MNIFFLKYNFSKHDCEIFDNNLFQQMYDFHIVQSNKLRDIYKFDYIDIEMDKIYDVMSVKLTRDTLINNYGNKFPNLNATNFPLDYWPWFGKVNLKHGMDIKNRKYSIGDYYQNGWITCTLSTLLNNKFDTNMRKGQDMMFNYKTVLFGYDYYLFPVKLGIYCIGHIENKISTL